MILTPLRMMESGDFSQRQECRDDDFQRVHSMIRMLVEHSSHMFSQLPAISKSAKPRDRKEQFLEMLPEKFTYQEFMDLARSLTIPDRTAQTYIFNFCEKGLIIRELKGFYRKVIKKYSKTVSWAKQERVAIPLGNFQGSFDIAICRFICIFPRFKKPLNLSS